MLGAPGCLQRHRRRTGAHEAVINCLRRSNKLPPGGRHHSRQLHPRPGSGVVLDTVIPDANAYQVAATVRCRCTVTTGSATGSRPVPTKVMHRLAWELIPSLHGLYAGGAMMRWSLAPVPYRRRRCRMNGTAPAADVGHGQPRAVPGRPAPAAAGPADAVGPADAAAGLKRGGRPGRRPDPGTSHAGRTYTGTASQHQSQVRRDPRSPFDRGTADPPPVQHHPPP